MGQRQRTNLGSGKVEIVWTPEPPLETATFQLPGGLPLEVCRIPQGTFWMGSREPQEVEGWPTDFSPRHQVCVNHDYWLGKHPVTLAQFRAFCAAQPFAWEKDLNNTHEDQPVVRVSWRDACEFCDWLNGSEVGTVVAGKPQRPQSLAGWRVGLPTEVEWERACRGVAGECPVEERYAYGDDESELPKVARFGLDFRHDEVPRVATREPTDWGLFDMHGLVWEWCADQYKEREYATRASLEIETASTARFESHLGRDSMALRGLRGGSWDNSAAGCRSAVRVRYRAGNSLRLIGFRVAVLPDSERAPPKPT